MALSALLEAAVVATTGDAPVVVDTVLSATAADEAAVCTVTSAVCPAEVVFVVDRRAAVDVDVETPLVVDVVGEAIGVNVCVTCFVTVTVTGARVTVHGVAKPTTVLTTVTGVAVR